MDCMLSTNGWLVCEVCAYVRRSCCFLACSPKRIFIKTKAVSFDVVGFFFCFFYFSDSTSTSSSTSTSISTSTSSSAMKLHHNSSGNKKKRVEPTSEVSNSNPFDVINSVDNDVEFGTNRGTTNLENNRAISSGSSFMNIDNDEEFVSNTPIGEKIDKIKRQIGDGKLRLLDNDGNLLVPTGIVESDSEVEVVFNETANLRIPMSGKDESDKGYGTNSLLEQ
ncbi:hypothetical protein Tco_1094875 [Tanacetum coccineum]